MRTQAIIIKKQNTNEYDQLVTCYTQEIGKVTAIAKSVLKPSSIQALHLDFFNFVDFDLISGKAFPIITGAQAENSYPRIKGNLVYSAIAYFFIEAVDKLAFDYQKDEGLWSFLVSLLGDLDQEPQDYKEFLRTKQIEFLDILGYAPNLTECVFCNKAEPIAYNTQAQGGVCKDCFLGGREGIVIKGDNLLSIPVLASVFEALAEKKLYSLNLLNSVLRP